MCDESNTPFKTLLLELDYLSNVCGLQQRLWKNAKGKVYCSLPFPDNSGVPQLCLGAPIFFFFHSVTFSLSAKVFFFKTWNSLTLLRAWPSALPLLQTGAVPPLCICNMQQFHFSQNDAHLTFTVTFPNLATTSNGNNHFHSFQVLKVSRSKGQLLTYYTNVKRCSNIRFLGESRGKRVTSEEIMRNVWRVWACLVLHRYRQHGTS